MATHRNTWFCYLHHDRNAHLQATIKVVDAVKSSADKATYHGCFQYCNMPLLTANHTRLVSSQCKMKMGILKNTKLNTTKVPKQPN